MIWPFKKKEKVKRNHPPIFNEKRIVKVLPKGKESIYVRISDSNGDLVGWMRKDHYEEL